MTTKVNRKRDAAERSVRGVVIGVLAGTDERGRPLVAYGFNGGALPVAARSVVLVEAESIGRSVAILFEGGDLGRPVVIGIVQDDVPPARFGGGSPEPGVEFEPARVDGAEARGPVDPLVDVGWANAADEAASDATTDGGTGDRRCRPALDVNRENAEMRVDGERVHIEAEREIVLRCGRASITLTRAGKVIIRGEYVSTRAAGVNRVRGGSVQIN